MPNQIHPLFQRLMRNRGTDTQVKIALDREKLPVLQPQSRLYTGQRRCEYRGSGKLSKRAQRLNAFRCCRVSG